MYPRTMWDQEPVLYWRCKINGKLTWRRAKAAYMAHMGMYAIEPPVHPDDDLYGGDESE